MFLHKTSGYKNQSDNGIFEKIISVFSENQAIIIGKLRRRNIMSFKLKAISTRGYHSSLRLKGINELHIPAWELLRTCARLTILDVHK
jgi:hypothetical protein